MPRPQTVFRGAALALGAALATAGPVAAQSGGDGYLFRAPVATLNVHGGFAHASAGSDLFAFTTEQLTLGRSDFSGPTVGGELALRVAPRLDVVLAAGYTGRKASSEFREWVDNEDQPIQQTTTFQRVPLTGGVKAYLTPRGRSVGSFAWIPARTAAFVGAGAGAMWYRFAQDGDFVDFETLEVFSDELASSGWAASAHALAGVDFSLSRHLALTAQTKYTWAEAGLGNSFEDFEAIDLSGLSATLGIHIRL